MPNKTEGKQTFSVAKIRIIALPDRINPNNIQSSLQTILDLYPADSAASTIL